MLAKIRFARSGLDVNHASEDACPAIAELGSSCAVLEILPSQRALAIVDHRNVALLNPAAERDDVRVDPQVCENRLAGVDRGGKAHVKPTDPRVVVLGNFLENRATGRTVGAE